MVRGSFFVCGDISGLVEPVCYIVGDFLFIMKVALVNDWLTSRGGEMNVLAAIAQIFPDAPIYTSVYNANKFPEFAQKDVRPSWLQKMPFASKVHKMIPMLRPHAFESLDFSEFDVVISSSHAESKGIITKPETIHICYCHTPTRYYWSHYHEYRHHMEFGILNPIARIAMPLFIHGLRQWDYLAAQRVDYFIANSEYVAARIKKYYHREAKVIYPPVDTVRHQYDPAIKKEDFYFTVSRLIPYKRFDILVAAATAAGVRLKVAGTGPELKKLQKIAGPTVEFVGFVSDQEKISLMQRAKGFLFAAEEDFGIVPVEAMACGTPVLAYGKGGLAEIVTNDTGILLAEQTVNAFVEGIRKMEHASFDPLLVRKRAEKFSQEKFNQQLGAYVGSLVGGA